MVHSRRISKPRDSLGENRLSSIEWDHTTVSLPVFDRKDGGVIRGKVRSLSYVLRIPSRVHLWIPLFATPVLKGTYRETSRRNENSLWLSYVSKKRVGTWSSDAEEPRSLLHRPSVNHFTNFIQKFGISVRDVHHHYYTHTPTHTW